MIKEIATTEFDLNALQEPPVEEAPVPDLALAADCGVTRCVFTCAWTAV